MSRIKIEKDIEAPFPRGQWKELCQKMRFNDSVLLHYRQYQAMHTAANKLGFSVVCKKENKKVRVWKVKK